MRRGCPDLVGAIPLARRFSCPVRTVAGIRFAAKGAGASLGIAVKAPNQAPDSLTVRGTRGRNVSSRHPARR